MTKTNANFIEKMTKTNANFIEKMTKLLHISKKSCTFAADFEP